MGDRHDAIEELLGAYALDALDPDELAAVEAHLDGCPTCRAEVAELRDVASQLADSDAEPPEELWERIVDAIEEPPPPLRLTVAGQARPRRSWRGRAIGAVAVAAALLVGALVVASRTTGSTTNHLRAAALDALAAPTSRVASLQNIAHATVARFVVTDDGHGYLLGDTMPPLDQQLYELWGRTANGTVLSLGVMNTPGTYGFAVDPTVDTVMITIEDRPVDQTTKPPVAVGNLA